MTYIAGWRFGAHAYLISDTALTLHPQLGQLREERAPGSVTSFGESNVSELNQLVCEAVLKTSNLGHAAVSFCGDVALATSVIRSFAARLREGLDPEQAFRHAVSDNGPFDDPERTTHLIVAIPQQPNPRLIVCHLDGDQQIHEIPDHHLVHFGSMAPKYAHTAAHLIGHLKSFAHEPDRFLTGALAILQTYGLHDYLMEHGVGGTFCGLHADTSTVCWQKDILYLLYHGRLPRPTPPDEPCIRMVMSIVRDDVLIVRSNISQSCRYFGHNPVLDDDWRAKWWDTGCNFASHGRFDFVIVLNTKDRIASVVEMLKHLSAKHLELAPPAPRSKEVGHIAFSRYLGEIMSQPAPCPVEAMPFRFNFLPYERPQEAAEGT